MHSIIKQRTQRAGPIGSELAEPLEIFAGLRILLCIAGMDLQRCEIELVEIILRFFFYGSGELFFLFGKVSFGTSQPACNNVKGGPVTISWPESDRALFEQDRAFQNAMPRKRD